MAILNYDGTNLGALSNSGYFRRFFSEFSDDAGQAWRVEILDSITTLDGFNFSDSDPQGFRLGPDGCTLDWSGKSDTMSAPFIESTLTLDFLLEGTRREKLKIELAKGFENRFAVALFKHAPHPTNSSGSSTVQDTDPSGWWVPEWFGVIQPDGVQSLTNEPNSFLRITAVDGLGLLNQLDYIHPNGTFYDDEATLAKTVGRCLEKLPTARLWGWALYNNSTAPGTTFSTTDAKAKTFLREYVYNYAHDEHRLELNPITFLKQSPLHHTAVLSPTFYKADESTDPLGGEFINKKGLSCGKVLEHILQVFQARLFLSGGEWHFMNPGAVNHSESDTDTPETFCFPTCARLAGGYSPTSHTMATVVVDINGAKLEPLSGLTDSYLYPIKRAMSVHVNGGSTVVLQAPPQPLLNNGGGLSTLGAGINNYGPTAIYSPDFYPYYVSPHDDISPIGQLQNADIHVPNGNELTLKGEFMLTETGRHDYSITEPDGIGLKAVCEFVIKVGDYYLKRDLVHSGSGDVINIQRNLQSDLSYQYLKQSGAIEWTTVASTYSFIIPSIGNDPEAAIVTQGDGDDAVDRVGGLHTANHGGENTDEFMHRAGLFGSGSEVDIVRHPLVWTLPPLPDVSAGFSGIEFSAYMTYFKYDGASLDYSSTSFLIQEEPARINSFRIETGDGGDGEQDAFFSASNGVNSAEVWASKSLLGDQYEGQLNGVLLADDVNTATNYLPGGARWRCRNSESGPDLFIHKLNAEQLARRRYRTTLIRNGSYLFNPEFFVAPWNFTTYKTLPGFHDLWAVTMAEVEVKLLPLSMTWTVKSRLFDLEAMAVDYEGTHAITNDDNQRFVKGSGGTGGIGGVPGEVSVQASIINSSGGNATNVPSGFNFTKFNFDALGLTTLIASDNVSGNRTITLNGSSSVNVQTMHTELKRLLLDYEDYDGHLKLHAPAGKLAAPQLQFYNKNQDAFTESVIKVNLQAQDAGTSYTLELPRFLPSDTLAVATLGSNGKMGSLIGGTNGQVLETNGSGGLSWQTPASGGSDGFHGSTTLLKVMPSEFIMNDDYNRAPTTVEDDVTNRLSVKAPAWNSEMYAFVIIPTGFKATHVKLYATATTTNTVTALSFDHTTGATVSLGTGNSNALIDITDTNSTTTKNLCIKFAPASNTTGIFGADVTIATI